MLRSLAIILLLLPLTCLAKFELSLKGGVNGHNGPYARGFLTHDASTGWSSSIRGIITFKGFETGFGFEFGNWPYRSGSGDKGSTHYEWPQGYDPYFSTHIFIHKTFTIGNTLVYGGLSTGVLSSTERNGSIRISSVNVTAKDYSLPDAAGFMSGLQAGCVHKLSKRFSFDGEAGARWCTLHLKQHERGIHNEYHMLYYPVTVGVRYVL